MEDRKIIMSGFGGQGIMVMGELTANAGLLEGKHVTWMPSYGPEMRGGAANCSVSISEEPIGAPNISRATDLIVMNEPSLEKFEDHLIPGGNLFINESLVKTDPKRTDINVYKIPVNEIAASLGNMRVGNMVMLGAFISVTGFLPKQSVLDSFLAIYGERKKSLLPLNEKAYDAGEEAAKEHVEKRA